MLGTACAQGQERNAEQDEPCDRKAADGKGIAMHKLAEGDPERPRRHHKDGKDRKPGGDRKKPAHRPVGLKGLIRAAKEEKNGPGCKQDPERRPPEGRDQQQSGRKQPGKPGGERACPNAQRGEQQACGGKGRKEPSDRPFGGKEGDLGEAYAKQAADPGGNGFFHGMPPFSQVLVNDFRAAHNWGQRRFIRPPPGRQGPSSGDCCAPGAGPGETVPAPAK